MTTIQERPETYQATVHTIQRLAKDAFATHTITALGPGEWRCSRPKSGIYSFIVIIRHGMVCIYGDVGEGVFRGGEAGDTAAWLKEAVHSPEYLMSKLRAARKFEDFYPDDALDYAREGAEGGSRLWKKILPEAEALRQNYELNAHTWPQLVYDHSGDGECCQIGFNYGVCSLWLVEALRWWAEHVEESSSDATV